MGNIEIYKSFGILGFGIFWIVALAIITKLRLGRANSLSAHAASAKRIALPFGIITVLSSVLLCMFFVKWFAPTFQLSAMFSIVVVIAFILYAVAGVVPDIKGIRRQVHLTTAVLASVLLLPAMLMIILNSYVSSGARLFTALSALIMLCVGSLFVTRRHDQEKFLIYEVLYFLCFDISIILATYAR